MKRALYSVCLMLLVCIMLVGCTNADDKLNGSYDKIMTDKEKAELLLEGIRAVNISYVITFNDSTHTFTAVAYRSIEVSGTYEVVEGVLVLRYTQFGEDYEEMYEYSKEGNSIWLDKDEYVKK